MKQVTSAIISNIQVMPGVYLVWLDCPDIAQGAQPGQFVMVRCGEGTTLRRPLSIHQLDGKARLALLFNIVGKGTHWLSQRQAGDELDLFGPLGNGYTIHASSRHLLLVAGGIGIAPLVFLAQKTVKEGRLVRLLLGAVTADQLCPQDLLPSKIELICATDDGTAGRKGFITGLLPEFMGGADQVFACGPAPMYRTMVNQHRSLLKTKPVQVSLEMRMGCGVGVCFSCTLKTKSGLKQVCKDGPIFELDDILWDKLNLEGV